MKKGLSFLTIAALTVQLLIPVPYAEAAVSLTAPSALLIEPWSQKIIYSRDPHRKQPPASTAKIVTALVILDLFPLDEWVRISSRVESVEPSKLYLKGGEQLRIKDLLKALLMKSANDAAMALAIAASGSETAFAELMTQKARSLGAQNTRFANASGLPAEGQYSTAYDLALIMREAVRNEYIVSLLKLKSTSIVTAGGRKFYLKSHNKMLWRRRGVIGKTGWTRNAKYCFVGLIEETKGGAIVSVLGSRKLWVDVTRLVDQVRGTSDGLAFGSRGEEVKKIQSALAKAGYFNDSTTGYFGKKTKQAVINFQRAQGLSADGIVGPQTQKALTPYL
jgi:D-alanyl-D-alanine carboxypeptidase (penicillin-binding protein 5/6)